MTRIKKVTHFYYFNFFAGLDTGRGGRVKSKGTFLKEE
jgi:hypothetical protein